MITVVLVDDHEVARLGVADMLDDEDDLTVIGHAGTVAEALAQIPELRPDIAVLDIRLPDGNGIELCRELRSRMPKLNCLMLTGLGDEQAMMEAILAGASGYMIKNIKGMDLVSAVRTVGTGGSLLDTRATAALMARLQHTTNKEGPLDHLTERERQILNLIEEGLTNRQIGQRLYLAEKTVKNYVSRLLAKLNMHTRTQAVVLAAELRDQARRNQDD